MGVHVRGTDKYLEQGFRLDDFHVLDTIRRVVSQIAVPYKILAASDETHYVRLLEQAFGSLVVSYDAIRSPSSETPLHCGSRFPAWRTGRDAVVECLLLAKADYLIGSASNLSTASRCFHPEMPAISLHDAHASSVPPGCRRRRRELRYPKRTMPLPAPDVSLLPCPVARRPPVGENIIVLPYYAATEFDILNRLALLSPRLPPGTNRYRFLLSARWDAPDPPDGLLERCAASPPLRSSAGHREAMFFQPA